MKQTLGMTVFFVALFGGAFLTSITKDFLQLSVLLVAVGLAFVGLEIAEDKK